jgi:Trk K+ transport system NAD-binding subunit
MMGERGDQSPGGRVVLLGDDGLGVRVLRELLELGITVTAVCVRPEAPFARAAQSAQVPLVFGDPENEETLKKVGVEEASVCVLLGDADLVNLHVALELQDLAPRARVVMRLFNISLTGAVRSMLVDVAVLSATELAFPAFVAAIFGRRNEAVLPVGTEVLQIVDLTAERTVDVRTLEESCQARVMAVGSTPFPVLDLEIVPGDEMRVVGTSRGLVELAHLVAPSALTAASDINDHRDGTSR